MPFKDILVLLDESRACERRLDAAIELANRHGAHLTGLAVVVQPSLPAYVSTQIPQEVLAEQQEESRRRLDAIVAQSRAKAEAAGVPFESRSHSRAAADLPELINLHGRYADLVVMGQYDPEEEHWHASRHLPEHVVLTAGRPVMIMPYIGAPAGFGKRVLIAWDAGREAARAVRDSLPLLEAAEAVTVLVVDDGSARQPGRAARCGHRPLPGPSRYRGRGASGAVTGDRCCRDRAVPAR